GEGAGGGGEGGGGVGVGRGGEPAHRAGRGGGGAIAGGGLLPPRLRGSRRGPPRPCRRSRCTRRPPCRSAPIRPWHQGHSKTAWNSSANSHAWTRAALSYSQSIFPCRRKPLHGTFRCAAEDVVGPRPRRRRRG